MMEVDFLPEHLVIVGGSYIGLEFGQMFRRFGSEVTIIEMGAAPDPPRGRGCLRGDPGHPRARGHPRSPQRQMHQRFARRGDEVAAGVDCTRGLPEVIGSHLLLAVGRRPNTDDLGLEEAGIAVDERGYIAVDDELRTNVPGIWALGDCNGRGAFTHTSYNDFEIVAANLLDNDQRRVSDRIPAYGLFIDPPLGRAGMTEAEVRATGPSRARRQAADDGRERARWRRARRRAS